MTDEVRRIARDARRWGYSAKRLGNQSDAEWRDFRERFHCVRATLLDLADMVDLCVRLEAGKDAKWD